MTSLRTAALTALRVKPRGFSLIELLVSVTIGLVVTLAVFGVLTASEARKRTSTSLNDANQSGAYAAYILDRAIRSAGTGYTDRWALIGGCALNATLRDVADSTDIAAWPRANALPAPFAGVPQVLRLAPVVIFREASAAGSDVLQLMSSSGGFGEAPAEIGPGNLTALQASLPNTIGFRANDIVLLAGGGQCLVTQVAANKPLCRGDEGDPAPTAACGPALQFGGRYHDDALTAFNVIAGASQSFAVPLGNVVTNNPPQFTLYGVGENSTLFSYDVLMANGVDAPLAMAESTRAMYAVYGTDPALDGNIVWQSPAAPPADLWSGVSLTDGSDAANARLRSIVAVRIGLVMRASNIERGDDVAPTAFTLFSDLPTGMQRTFDVAEADRHQRHRTIEVTVPVRNFLMHPRPTVP